jgi:hypothetical protein
MIRIGRNKDLNNIHVFMFDVIMVIGIGRRRRRSSSSSSCSCHRLSRSKIVKIAVIKKNHDENGSCVEFLGSILHSSVDNFFGLHYLSFRLKC